MVAGPTQRTLKYLRGEGFKAEVVEKWIPQAKRRKDLFGFIDVVAIAPNRIIGVQATSGSNHNARIKKIESLEESQDWIKAGGEIWVISWRKLKGKGRKQWFPRVENLTGEL
jgi:hypothetical protein